MAFEFDDMGGASWVGPEVPEDQADVLVGCALSRLEYLAAGNPDRSGADGVAAAVGEFAEEWWASLRVAGGVDVASWANRFLDETADPYERHPLVLVGGVARCLAAGAMGYFRCWGWAGYETYVLVSEPIMTRWREARFGGPVYPAAETVDGITSEARHLVEARAVIADLGLTALVNDELSADLDFAQQSSVDAVAARSAAQRSGARLAEVVEFSRSLEIPGPEASYDEVRTELRKLAAHVSAG